MLHQLLVALLLGLAARPAAGWGCRGSAASPTPNPIPCFSVVPAASQALGQGQLTVLQGEAGKETFLDRLLGTNCYGQAVAELGEDCRRMDQEQKSRLALRLVNCQLATHGDTTYLCGAKAPLRQCTKALPDRAYQLYVEFLSHADNMCLFIQNQNFEKYTETMLNRLVDSSAYAKDAIAALSEQAAAQHAEVSRQAQEFAAKAEESLRLGREQREVQQEVLDTARSHRSESQAYFASLSARTREVLELQEEAYGKQLELQRGQDGMAAVLAAGSNRVESLFSFIDERAERQLGLQREHEARQRQLTAELRDLAADTQGLRAAVDVVVRYEQRSDAALIKLLGRSYTLEDAAFYGAGLLGVAATGVVPGAARARLPLLALLCSGLAGERLLLARLHMMLDLGPDAELVVHLPTHMLPPLPAALGLPAPSEPLALNVKWVLRKALVALGLGLVAYAVLSYRNYERDSYNAIRRMELEAQAQRAEQREQLARIEQRVAAIQAWEQQQALALARGKQSLPLAAGKAGRGKDTAHTAAAAALLLPPGFLSSEGGLAEELGPAGSLEGWPQLDGEGGQWHQGLLSGPLDSGVAPRLPQPAAAGNGPNRPSGMQPTTPAAPGGSGGRKRRGSEDAQETAPAEGAQGGKPRRRPSGDAEAPPAQRKAGRGKRQGQGAAEGGAAKRSRQ